MLSHIGFSSVYLRFVCPLSFSHFLLFTSLQTYLCKQRNSSTNTDPFSFHFISELVRLCGLDQSILIEPDSTFPVRRLNKLLQPCSTPYLLSFPSFLLCFPPPPCFSSVLEFLISSPLHSSNLHVGVFSYFCDKLLLLLRVCNALWHFYQKLFNYLLSLYAIWLYSSLWLCVWNIELTLATVSPALLSVNRAGYRT